MPSKQSHSKKSPVRLQRFSDLQFEPRFEYGHMAEMAETCGVKDGSELGSGFARMKSAHIPWTIHYDEMLTVIEGELRVHANGEVHHLYSKDSLWIPAGTEVVYEAKEALIVYAIHPTF